MENQTPDKPYWQNLALRNYADKIKCPFFIMTSYFDLLGEGGIDIYTKLMEAPGISEEFKKHAFLKIGPWGHGVNMKEGEYTFGPDSIVSEDLEVDFLSSVLTGKEPATDREPGRICYFTMGENKWHYTNEWPLPNTKYVNFYLGSYGSANTSAGNGFLTRTPLQADLPADHFTYDPAKPVPTCGGRMVGAGGQKCQSEVEMRQDVLVYTSPKLTEDLTITGNVRLKFYISSSAPDTDFTAKLVDVQPDGRPMNICDGIQRVRWRNNAVEPQFLKSGEVAEIDMPVDFTSYQFKAGHSIRLEISSSNFPHFERNLNTGKENNAKETEMQIAEQTVWHDLQYPSCLILPVIE